MPKGTQAPTDGYFGDTDTARTTFEALMSTRIERDTWKNAMYAVSGDIAGIQTDFSDQLRALNGSFRAEQAAARQKAARSCILALVLGGLLGAVIGGH